MRQGARSGQARRCLVWAAVAGAAVVPGSVAAGADAAWREITSDHFVVRTDTPPSMTDDLIRTLEQARAAMLATIWGGASGPPGRIQVIALASHAELETYADGTVAGLTVHASPFPATIVLGGFGSDDERAIANHELAHRLGEWFLPVLPTWLREGLASFAESVRYDRGEEKAYAGDPSPRKSKLRKSYGILPKDQLFGLPPSGAAYGRFLGSSWTLVHYLIARRKEAFERFQHRLQLLETPDRAWAAEFPDLVDDEHLYAALDGYSATAVPSFVPRHVPPFAGQFDVRPLSASAIHAARAYLRTFVGGEAGVRDSAVFRAELAAALAADPAQLEALALSIYVSGMEPDPATRKAIAASALAAHPGSWLAWLMVADYGGDPQGPAARAAVAHAERRWRPIKRSCNRGLRS